MPTYEYQCTKCGDVFEVFQSIKASPLRKSDCKRCGEKRPVRRLVGAGGAVLFKGSGFYETDYRSESYKKAVKAEGKKKEGGGSSDGADKAPATTKSGEKQQASRASDGGDRSKPPSKGE